VQDRRETGRDRIGLQLPLRFFFVILRVGVATLLKIPFIRRIDPWQVEL